MAIEFFTEAGRGFAPKVSIRKQGQIGLNQGAVLRHKIKDGQFAILGYDKEEGFVAIKFVSDDEKGAKRITVRHGNASISAKSFLDYFNIPYRETISYNLECRDELLIFFLKGKKEIESNGI
jgi:hypothetical protein